MARVYLMIEDSEEEGGGINFATDFGLEDGEQLAEDPDDQTMAQETLSMFVETLERVNAGHFRYASAAKTAADEAFDQGLMPVSDGGIILPRR